ncbi:histidine kinase [Aliidongia dinghuensis]|uniref:Histidine kinase n=1 Tax=Aliidongia dinghuensis TaxID=1867774 RepID=A0A8J2YQQ2_9PROT|nr:efflux transporter outer membrane subunit [Aliidongia dinghuensis]GGF06436.1 histidine kinase [Aliidongia dinghuensis]
MINKLVPRTAIVALLLSGCAVGPDFTPPPAPDVKGYAKEPLAPETVSVAAPAGASQRFVGDMDIPGQWWTLFHSPALNALIEQALKTNHDLTAAQAALRQAEENEKATAASFFPTVEGNYSASRQKNALGTLAATLFNNQPIFSLHTAQLTISYTPDVFGGTRRAVESAMAQAEQQRFELEATYLTLTSNLVAAAVQEASLRGQIAATGRLVAIERELTDLFHRQRALGQVADADILVQEAALAQTEATLPPLEKQLAQQRDLVTALCGRLPSNEPEQTFELASLDLPVELPVSLPSNLVEQRPDVRAAEENLHAATAEVGVAIAAMLPQFSISGFSGTAATDIAKLFTPGNGFWGITGGVDQTFFDGGALLHKRRGADAAMDQAAEQYQSTVVAAFQNVADALHAVKSDADALKAQVAAEQAAERSLDLVRKELPLGQVSHLTVLNAEQIYQQAVIARVQAQAARLADTAALFQALGGGWWNRRDVDVAKL